MARLFSDVLDATINAIPTLGSMRDRDLLLRLRRIKKDLGFAAPETHWPMKAPIVVDALQAALDSYTDAQLIELDGGWRARAMDAWTGSREAWIGKRQNAS